MLLALFLPLFFQATLAQDFPSPSLSKNKLLIIGTKVAKPFAMKDKEGKWHGISIELWEKIAKELDLKFEWKEHNLSALLKSCSLTDISFPH